MQVRIRRLTLMLVAVGILLTSTGCIAPLLSELFFAVGPILLY